MSLFTEMVADADAVIVDELGVTVINLTQRRTCDAVFQGNDAKADRTKGLKNIATSVLWVPLDQKYFRQQDKLRITMPDGAVEDFTVEACGARQGAFLKVELIQQTVTRAVDGVQI